MQIHKYKRVVPSQNTARTIALKNNDTMPQKERYLLT